MKKRSPWSFLVLCALTCEIVFLGGCGQSYYFGGRALPPSGILNRVLIAIQNPGTLTKGTLQIVDLSRAPWDFAQNIGQPSSWFARLEPTVPASSPFAPGAARLGYPAPTPLTP